MEGVAVRSATLNDLDALLALEADFPEADRFSRRGWRRVLTGRSAVWIAEAGGEPVGAAAVLLRNGARVARLYSLSVATPWRGRGAARALLAAAMAAAEDHGCDRMRLEVRRSNRAAIALYERSGFDVIGSVPGYYADGEDALRMEARTMRSADDAA